MPVDEELLLRLVVAFENIGAELGAIRVIQEKRYDQQYPERHVPQRAVVTRVPNEEDKIREKQGTVDRSVPAGEWFGGYEDEGFVGIREKAFIEEEKAKQRAAAEVGG